MAFSPDGRLLASGGSDSTIKIWDLSTWHELRSLPDNAGAVFAFVFTPDGKTLVSGGQTIKIWDVATGQKLRSMPGISEGLALSPDGRTLASGNFDHSITLWDVATGQLLRTLTGHTYIVKSVAFSPDGRTLASGGFDNAVKLWDIATGKELRTLSGHTAPVWSTPFSRDGRTLISISEDGAIKFWDVPTGQQLRSIDAHGQLCFAAISPDGKILATAGITIKLWDLATAHELRTFTGDSGGFSAVAFSPDGITLAAVSGTSIRRWNAATGEALDPLTGHTLVINKVSFSPDGRTLATHSWGVVKVWDLSSGRFLDTLSSPDEEVTYSPQWRTLAVIVKGNNIGLGDLQGQLPFRKLTGHTGKIESVAFSPGEQILASGGGYSWNTQSGDTTIKLWDVPTGKELRTLPGQTGDVESLAFSPDGKILASGGGYNLLSKKTDTTIKLWDVATGDLLYTLEGHTDEITFLRFSSDGKTLISHSLDKTIRLWSVATGEALRTLPDHTGPVAVSPDGRTIVSGSADKTLRIWDTGTWQQLQSLKGYAGPLRSICFSPDGRFLASAGFDGITRIWDVSSGRELAGMVWLDEHDWAVVTPEGVFDASPGGMQLMHWIAGHEVIELNQLKERYYDPGLLAKVFGYDKEPIRDVSAFTSVALFPDVETISPVDDSGKLRIKLKNRGGGIGRIQVFVNGQEVLADARGPKPDPEAAEASLTLDLAGASVRSGKPNEIRIVAWNQDGYLSSRGVKTNWAPKGDADARPPEFYAIVAGISTYASPQIKLSFSSKDAKDMARALALGATRLFGAEHVHVTLLTSSGEPGVLQPTKVNLKQAFVAAQKARPGDVLVVYLAGHGVAIRDMYVYPTAEARSLTDFSDPDIRNESGITSEELVDWIRQIPALHRVMILDTCAAGAAALKLVEKRDVPSDQIRALDRLKDRTGFHVLMGSAADAVSYETSRYGQGLLTYSLLQGMKGAALKNDDEVDVSTLFQFAADRVPELAKDIGGIQRPQILPGASGSFDVGVMQKEDKERIPLASIKPLILRPNFINPRAHRDDLGLSAAVRKRLREEIYASERGKPGAASAVFVDEEEYPGAISPSGDYTVDGTEVKVTVVLSRDDKEITQLTIEGDRNDPDALAAKIVQAILKATDAAI